MLLVTVIFRGKGVKVGILETGVPPDELIAGHGSYADMLSNMLMASGYPFEFEIFSVYRDEFPNAVDECDGWVVTGSASSAYDSDPWIDRLKTLIRQLHALHTPMLGICFGHQVIAEALGGRVERFNGGWGCGLHHYQTEADLADSLKKDSLALHAMHQDQVVERPIEAEVILHSAFCANAGLRYGEEIVTLQPHPEFSRVFETELLCSRAGQSISREQVKSALASMAVDSDASVVARWLAEFLYRPATA